MKKYLILVILFLVSACGKKEEGFLSRELSNQERQYLQTQRRDKCLEEVAIKADFEKSSVATSNSFKSLSSSLNELNNASTPKSLVYQKTQISENDGNKDTTKTDFYIIGFNGAKNEFYYLQVSENGTIENHGKYNITKNGDDLVKLQKDFCTYRSAAHTYSATDILALKLAIESTSTPKVNVLTTKSFEVNGALPVYFSKDPKNESETTTDDRGASRKITVINESITFTRVSGKYSTLSSASKPFCDYYESKFQTDLGDCSQLSYNTVLQSLLTAISAE